MLQHNPLSIKEATSTEDLNSSIKTGVWPVGLTAFTSNGCIDWDGHGQLLDWYVSKGVSGIFTVCLSGEMYCLNEEERLGLAEFSRARVNSEVGIVAAAGFGKNFSERLASVKRMSETGVDAVVIPVCQLVEEKEDDDELCRELEKLLAKTEGIKLGLYECPLPYHRLLGEKSLKLAAESGKIHFLKDTCCDKNMLAERLRITNGTKLNIFNANTATNLISSEYGASGYCGTGANFFPELFVELWNCHKTFPEKAERIQTQLDVLHRHVCYKYPRSAKYFLQLCGVKINDYCRWDNPDLTAQDKEILQQLKSFNNTLMENIQTQGKRL